MKQVIFDTDIGIDDAMAMLLLHYAPSVNLIAITTCFGNASLADTTRNALFMKEQFGMSAPVYAGANESMGEPLGEGFPDFVHGKNGLGDIPIIEPSIHAESIPAAQAIVDMVTKQPGEISIVAVGRMTNIADALILCPELPSMVKELVVMGGVFGFREHQGNVSPVAEANIAGDPTAADVVFTSGMPTTIVGLDVTHEIIMDRDYLELLRSTAGAAGQLIYDTNQFYFAFHERINGSATCPIHDSTAVAYLIRPDLFTTKQGPVRVATKGVGLGQTILGQEPNGYATDAWNDLPACHVCFEVDAKEVLALYVDTLSAGGKSS